MVKLTKNSISIPIKANLPLWLPSTNGDFAFTRTTSKIWASLSWTEENIPVAGSNWQEQSKVHGRIRLTWSRRILARDLIFAEEFARTANRWSSTISTVETTNSGWLYQLTSKTETIASKISLFYLKYPNCSHISTLNLKLPLILQPYTTLNIESSLCSINQKLLQSIRQLSKHQWKHTSATQLKNSISIWILINMRL